MKRKQRPTDGGGNWMDTYGDMVTLLLTFFVMLYSMSNLNEQKWEVFVRSISPDALVQTGDQVAINGAIDNAQTQLTGTLDVPVNPAQVDINTLYLTIAEKMNDIGIDGVTISRGNDYTFIEFQDKTFFDGDSSVLTKQGENTLQVFCDAIAPAQDQLSQVNIMAHTAQGDPGHPNNPRTDRMLSAMRAAEVCIFIQSRNAIQPEKLVNISYGQFRPLDSNETREGRARNRRVEILMIDKGATARSLNEYYDEFNGGVNADRTVVTDGQPVDNGHGFVPAMPSKDGVSTILSPLGGSGKGETAQTGSLPETTVTKTGTTADTTAE